MESPKKDLNLTLDSLVETLQDLRSKIIYKIILETSCKTLELSQLKVSNITSKEIKFKNRSVNISKNLKSLIRKFIKENSLKKESFLFSTRQSEKISTKRIRQIIQETSFEKLGYKISPKNLRNHSIRNKLIIKDLKEVKKESGLKRLDKRKYLTDDQIKTLEKNIKSKKTYLIFKLLLNNFKPHKISNLKVEDILDPSIPDKITAELEKYITSNKISFGEYIFGTKQKTLFSKITIFNLIKNLGKKSEIKISPQILNNTAIYKALTSKKIKQELNKLGIKNSAFHLHGGFYNE